MDWHEAVVDEKDGPSAARVMFPSIRMLASLVTLVSSTASTIRFVMESAESDDAVMTYRMSVAAVDQNSQFVVDCDLPCSHYRSECRDGLQRCWDVGVTPKKSHKFFSCSCEKARPLECANRADRALAELSDDVLRDATTDVVLLSINAAVPSDRHTRRKTVDIALPCIPLSQSLAMLIAQLPRVECERSDCSVRMQCCLSTSIALLDAPCIGLARTIRLKLYTTYMSPLRSLVDMSLLGTGKLTEDYLVFRLRGKADAQALASHASLLGDGMAILSTALKPVAGGEARCRLPSLVLEAKPEESNDRQTSSSTLLHLTCTVPIVDWGDDVLGANASRLWGVDSPSTFDAVDPLTLPANALHRALSTSLSCFKSPSESAVAAMLRECSVGVPSGKNRPKSSLNGGMLLERFRRTTHPSSPFAFGGDEADIYVGFLNRFPAMFLLLVLPKTGARVLCLLPGS